MVIISSVIYCSVHWLANYLLPLERWHDKISDCICVRTMQKTALKIIGVHLNRAINGLHFPEESARFILNNTILTQRIEHVRHDLVSTGVAGDIRALTRRDANLTGQVIISSISESPL